jgi:hypothetical protein
MGNNTVIMNGVTYTGYQAGPGWDPVAGLGSPDAAVLVPILSHRPIGSSGAPDQIPVQTTSKER